MFASRLTQIKKVVSSKPGGGRERCPKAAASMLGIISFAGAAGRWTGCRSSAASLVTQYNELYFAIPKPDYHFSHRYTYFYICLLCIFFSVIRTTLRNMLRPSEYILV